MAGHKGPFSVLVCVCSSPSEAASSCRGLIILSSEYAWAHSVLEKLRAPLSAGRTALP
jgi:hypothetical protein